jgi:hypothetical protein
VDLKAIILFLRTIFVCLLLGNPVHAFGQVESQQIESSPVIFGIKGAGFGLGYSALLQESQIELLTEIGQRPLTLHLGRALWQYSGTRGENFWELDSRIYSLAASTRWFVIRESPLYILVGLGVFSAAGNLKASSIDVIRGNEVAGYDFLAKGMHVFSHLGVNLDVFRRFYVDFAIQGVGKSWPLSLVTAGRLHRDVLQTNFSATRLYGLLNIKFGISF